MGPIVRFWRTYSFLVTNLLLVLLILRCNPPHPPIVTLLKLKCDLQLTTGRAWMVLFWDHKIASHYKIKVS